MDAPRYANGSRKTVHVESPRRSTISSHVRLAAPSNVSANGAIRLLGFVILVAVLLYVVVGSTLAYVSFDGNQAVIVRWDAFPVGAAPVGSVVQASLPASSNTTLSKITTALNLNGARAEITILADPGSTLSIISNTINVNGHTTGVQAGNIKAQVLPDNYLATCVAGACGLPDQAIIVPQNAVTGLISG